ncbi:hypothetical protein FRC07_010945, partial [Ceratobasidium sp. 392]
TPGPLKSLVISGKGQEFMLEARRSWPTAYLQGLVKLQLLGVAEFARPTFEELTTTLSGSELLHTLRLRDMAILPGNTSAIFLPGLQVLDIIGLESDSLVQLLTILSPGSLELDLRLGLRRLEDSEITDVIVPFCMRSNVVSLYLSESINTPSGQVIPFLSALSSMQVLVLEDFRDRFHSLSSLIAVDDGLQIARCPELRTLCLHGNDETNQRVWTDLRRVAEVCPLDIIVLDSCNLASEGSSNSECSGDEEQKVTEEQFLDEISELAEHAVVNDGIFMASHAEVDKYIRQLIIKSQK